MEKYLRNLFQFTELDSKISGFCRQSSVLCASPRLSGCRTSSIKECLELFECRACRPQRQHVEPDPVLEIKSHTYRVNLFAMSASLIKGGSSHV